MTITAPELVAIARLRLDPAEARRQRHRAKLSLSDVAAACGATTATISRWETGMARIPANAKGLAYLDLLRRLEVFG